MPLLRIKRTGALTPRIQRIEAEGFISTRREGNQKLFIKLNRAAHETKQSYAPKRTNNNTIDNSTKTLEIAPPSVAEKEVAEIIDAFKDVNPAYRRLFSQPPQREAVKNLLAAYGFEDLKRKVGYLKKIIVMPYAPRITTPYMLELKMGDLMACISQERGKTKQSWTVI